jgi:Predicted hydrolase of the metallo-beta-lactamase superfamily
MNIKIHRGANQIGGNIIEVSTAHTKILLDVGLDLDASKNSALPEIDGLFNGKGFDAIFISHYHMDHMGLAYDVCKDIPIFIGRASYNIIKASDNYKGASTFLPKGFLSHKETFVVGDIKVTPFLCDHSAFDSYMLLVEADNERLLYTGDFRSNGRKPFEWLLNELPKNIDILICEGTTLSREGYVCQTETEIEEKAVELINNADGPIFVLQSSMNIDRIVTMFRAAKRSKRIFLEDLYLAEITSSIGGKIPNPLSFDNVKTFVAKGYPKESPRYKMFNRYGENRIGKEQISQSKYVMCIRTSMLAYLKSLSDKSPFQNGVLIYSFWSGYKEQPEMKLFLEECEKMGLKIQTLHTSGHADGLTIKRLIETVKPRRIEPVHTENADWFYQGF